MGSTGVCHALLQDGCPSGRHFSRLHAVPPRAPSTGSKQGVYREVVELERLVFTFAWEDAEGKPGHETLVTVTFAEHGTKTKLTLHQGVFETVAACDSHQSGWASTLERFAEYLASL
ncbi:MAG TPA: SRPBCC domain-containing protein [Stellaceae bacterium]|nr:SRPBCC domain-containing protein [Stellaceae bacterium]